MTYGWWYLAFGLSVAFAATGCSGNTVRSPETNDSGGMASGGSAGSSSAAGGISKSGSGGMSGSGGQAATGDYGLFVNATTVSTVTEYQDVVASIREGASGNELSVVGTIVDPDTGSEGHTAVFVSPYPEPGTYDCTTDGSYITTVQLCCLNTYDTRNEPHDVCTITLTAAGSAPGSDVAGTFEGILHDENGGRMFLRQGRFRAKLAD